jgi:hypothetical protein
MSEQEEGGMDLRDALRGVDPRDYIPLLDAIREDPEKMKKFVTYLAQENPPVFLKFARFVIGGPGALDWCKLDSMLKADDANYIPVIKEVRQVTEMGLKEAKRLVDERRVRLGLRASLP